MKIEEILECLRQGKMAYRSGWNGKGLFVFLQNPSFIPKEVIPKLQSMPDSVKEELANRFNDPEVKSNGISFCNQFAILKPNNEINGWVPSVSDLLAEDWIVK